MTILFREAPLYISRFKTVVSFEAYGKVEERDFFGTGIWITIGGKNADVFFITNRHLTDYSFAKDEWEKIGAKKIEKLDIELRKRDRKSRAFTDETKFFDIITGFDNIFYPQDDSDIAVLHFNMSNPMMDFFRTVGFCPYCMNLFPFVADENYFSRDLLINDHIAFLGYPKNLYDPTTNYPISRIGSISSIPFMPFGNKFIPKGDVVLVSGLSFGGSSGSPVFSLPVNTKGIGFGRVLEAKLVGIMAGHLEEKNQHKGLSYFYKSTKIFEILAQNGFLS